VNQHVVAFELQVNLTFDLSIKSTSGFTSNRVNPPENCYILKCIHTRLSAIYSNLCNITKTRYLQRVPFSAQWRRQPSRHRHRLITSLCQWRHTTTPLWYQQQT